MMRSYRFVVFPLLLVLLYASFAAIRAPLQVRAASNIFTVTSAADPFPPDGSCAMGSPDGCTLREAITLVNSTPVSDTNEIRFQIPKNTVGYTRYSSPVPRETWTITLTQTLPPLTRNGTLIDGTTQRTVPGTLNPLGAPIVFINGVNLTSNVRGLIISSSDNTIRNLGLIDFRNGTPGVGIDITRQKNLVQGNYIGMNQIGLAPAPNRIGVRLFGDGARENLIGGKNDDVAQRNLISGNQEDGVRLEQTDSAANESSANRIQGNYIGVDLFGTAPANNGGSGVSVFESSANIIGVDPASPDTAYGNIISGNQEHGVLIRDADNNLVNGNRIGVDYTASETVGNTMDGVRIESTGGAAAGNKVGDAAPAARNIITGNGQVAVHVTGLNVSGTVIANNYIGVAGDGTSVVGDNFQTGVVVEEGADGTRIGGAAGQGNLIGNNSGAIQVFGRNTGSTLIGSTGTVISGNNIGVGPDNKTPRPNTGVGILLSVSVSQSQIGGEGAGNLIANNTGDGIRIIGTQMLSNTLLGNRIVGNGGNGLVLDGARNTLVSGGGAAAPSPISDNGGEGVWLSGTISTTVSYSQIGRNAGNGILVDTASTTTTVSANLIGTTLITRTNVYSDTGNGGSGVRIQDDARATTVRDNRIYFNDGDGVLVTDSAQRAAILSNSISRNGGAGIELDPETEGVPGSASNPNRDINPPGDLRLTESGRLTGRVPVGTAPGACVTCTIQIFVNQPFDDDEGLTQLSATPQIDRSGFFTATLGSVPTELTVTATDWYGNTSEFAVLTSTFGLEFSPPQTKYGLPTQAVRFNHMLTNTGTIDLTNLQLTTRTTQGWTNISVQPSTMSLKAGESLPVTLTVTLPPGTDPTARAGTVERTGLRVTSATVPTATATVTDTTIVSPSFVLEVTPLGSLAEVLPGQSGTLGHTIRNNGNFTGTVEITATLDPSGSQFPMNFSPSTITLGPGGTAPLNITVSVPNNTQPTVPPVRVGVRVRPVGIPDQQVVFTDTVTVATVVAAQLTPGALEVSAAPGQLANFQHTVENLSTGTATFRLATSSSQGSEIDLVSNTNGVVIDGEGRFTLASGNQQGGINILNFLVKVTVNPELEDGDTDQITVYLYKTDGTQIGTAIDTVRVEEGGTPTTLYMPYIVESEPAELPSRTRRGGR